LSSEIEQSQCNVRARPCARARPGVYADGLQRVIRRGDCEGLAVIRAATGGVETLADGDLIGRIGHCLEDGTAQPTGGTGKGILRDSHAGERRYAPDESQRGKYSAF